MAKGVTISRWNRRRLLKAIGIGSAVAVIGTAALPTLSLDETPAPKPKAVRNALFEFTSDLFGRPVADVDSVDLYARLDYLLASQGPIAADCVLLGLYVDHLAVTLGSTTFAALDLQHKVQVVDQVMEINPISIGARLLAHFSSEERAFYRMRWSAVPQLAWLYRHSATAWKARGYTHWAGIAGDWREVLQIGPSYP